jgi:RHS repeat-associated protein
MVSRSSSHPGVPTGTVHYIYDTDGHLIAEANAATGVTTREYIWLPSNDNGPVDLPIAIAEAGAIFHVHADHLGRPIRMTNGAKTTVWSATWKPWGEIQSITGTLTNNLRYPGQYFQIETNLHYNWHRHYDPVTGRYTQPDPLGFVDGPSIYAYAGSSPFMYTDRKGLEGEPQGWPDNYPRLPLGDDKMRGLPTEQLRDMRERLNRGRNFPEAEKIEEWEKKTKRRNKGKQRGGPIKFGPWIWIPAVFCSVFPQYCGDPNTAALPQGLGYPTGPIDFGTPKWCKDTSSIKAMLECARRNVATARAYSERRWSVWRMRRDLLRRLASR